MRCKMFIVSILTCNVMFRKQALQTVGHYPREFKGHVVPAVSELAMGA